MVKHLQHVAPKFGAFQINPEYFLPASGFFLSYRIYLKMQNPSYNQALPKCKKNF